jgi:hypothetical protein
MVSVKDNLATVNIDLKTVKGTSNRQKLFLTGCVALFGILKDLGCG